MATGEEIERHDIEALLATRRELGQQYDSALVDSFAERVERAIAERTGDHARTLDRAERNRSGGQIRQFVLGLVSAGVGVPLTIVPMVAAENGLPAVVVAWLGIIGVNAAHAAAVNGPRRRE